MRNAAVMQNLTGVPAIFGTSPLVGNAMSQLSEEEQLQRKKKLMAAGQTDNLTTAIETMFGNRLNSYGMPRA